MERAGDDPRGALVRPYAVTRGRTEPQRDIAIEAVPVTTARGKQEARVAGRDKQMIASLCDGRAQSLAESAAYTRLPLRGSRGLVAGIGTDGVLAVPDPPAARNSERRM